MIDSIYRHFPAYYSYMYLDGYTPNEIMYALQKKKREQFKKKTIIDTIDIEKIISAQIDKTLDQLLKNWK